MRTLNLAIRGLNISFPIHAGSSTTNIGRIMPKRTVDCQGLSSRRPCLQHELSAGSTAPPWASGPRRPTGCLNVTFQTVVVTPARLPVQWSKMPTNLAGIEVVAVNANDGVSPS